MIAIGSDHGGYELKETLKGHLESLGVACRDYGTDTPDRCDYPDYGAAVARAVAEGTAEKGIVICSTGIGISIAANKVPGIRAALCGDCYSAEFCRRHNDANVLALGAQVTGPGLAKRIVEIFLKTAFERGADGRHARRVGKIAALEAAARD